MDSTSEINKFLGLKKISLNNFKELKFVFEIAGNDYELKRKVLSWFRFLQLNEIEGWRTKRVTKNIVHLLISATEKNPIVLFSLFCPSYKKGLCQIGFRQDGVGNTSLSGIDNLAKFFNFSKDLFPLAPPLAIFFDLAVERFTELKKNNLMDDINKNISNLKKKLPKYFEFIQLSDFQYLRDKVGYSGLITENLLIPDSTLKKIVNRGKVFYELFGWDQQQIIQRSKIIAASEALVGKFLRDKFPMGIMLYTPTMLERAEVYSGMEYNTNPFPIVFPNKGL